MSWNNYSVTMMFLAENKSLSNTTNGSDVNFLDMTGATIASPIIMFLSGLIGNLLALLVLHRTRLESQRLMFHSLVAGLVWNDLIGIILTSPVTIVSYINGLQMPGGDHLCRFNGFIMICFGLSTPLIVSAMAIERFLFVKYTFFYTKHCAPGAARLVMVIIWGFVLFFGLLPMFGFGNYVLQYPRTWCFLDFRTTNPVYAAYGYIYSILNLLLVGVMVVCNLVVVVTLARVRDYRRKYSTSSLNSVLIGDGVMDDSQRQQAIVRRRKQKDIELQMIVVMCAITTIFAVCWVPLMMYISLTLATQGRTAGVLGLIAIRLASLNQTLNPWLYVILRRALIIRIKKYCCRWRKYLRTRSNLSPTQVARRHQYVHVRNQLCHRNNFVGGEINNDSISDSMRKSIQQAVPVAMSLPDVMMVNTGRRDLDMPLPDVAKAESYAGRVSHSNSLDNIISCAYCNSPAEVGCVECLTERYAAARMASKLLHANNQKYPANEEYPKCPNNSKISNDNQEIKISNDQILYSKRNDAAPAETNSKTSGSHGDHFKHDSDKVIALEISTLSREALVCSKHSSHSKHIQKDLDLQSSESKSAPQKKTEKELFSMTSSSVRGSSLRGWSHESRLSQHMHKTKNNSRSSSSKTSSSKGRPVSRLSGAGDGPVHNMPASERHQVRTESLRSEPPQEQDYDEHLLDDSRDSDNVFNDGTDTTCLETRKDTTTDDVGFSSMRTDSLYISDTNTASPDIKASKVTHESFLNNIGNICKQNHTNGITSSNHPDEQLSHTSNAQDSLPRNDGLNANTLQIPQPNLQRLITTKELNKPTYPSYAYQAYHLNTSDSSSCLLRDDSDNESERSSGIFSAESPAKNSKDLGSQPKFQVKKDSQSEPFHEMNSVKKQAAKRVKSYN